MIWKNGSVEKNPDGSLDIFIASEEPGGRTGTEKLAAGTRCGGTFHTGIAGVHTDELTIRGE